YGYYQKGENVEEAVFMAEEYEALMARQGFTFLRTDTVSKSDYKLHWTKKYDGSVMQARIHYQFLIPYFKITIEDIRVTFSNGEVLNISSHLQNGDFSEKCVKRNKLIHLTHENRKKEKASFRRFDSRRETSYRG